jgi:hypothetical protein
LGKFYWHDQYLCSGDGSCVTDPCWYDVGLPALKHTEAVIVECNTNSSCQNFVTDNIQLVPQDLSIPATVVCLNVGRVESEVGVYVLE